MDTTTLSFRVNAEKLRRLEKLAASTDRPKSWLLERALDAFLETQAWQVAHVEQGIRELEQGKGVPHAEVAKLLKSWGSPDKKRKAARKRR
jgi:predicted transcriptional regulator